MLHNMYPPCDINNNRSIYIIAQLVLKVNSFVKIYVLPHGADFINFLKRQAF